MHACFMNFSFIYIKIIRQFFSKWLRWFHIRNGLVFSIGSDVYLSRYNSCAGLRIHRDRWWHWRLYSFRLGLGFIDLLEVLELRIVNLVYFEQQQKGRCVRSLFIREIVNFSTVTVWVILKTDHTCWSFCWQQWNKIDR